MSIHRKSNVHRFSKKNYNSNGYRTGYTRPSLGGGEIHYDRKGRRIGASAKETKSSGSSSYSYTSSYSSSSSSSKYSSYSNKPNTPGNQDVYYYTIEEIK